MCSGRMLVMSRPSAARAVAQVDAPFVAEGLDDAAGARVDRGQEPRVQIEQAAIAPVGALPEVDAARRDGPFVRPRPQLAARSSVERDDLVVAREHVHDVVDDDGIEHEAALADREAPRDFELRDVRLVDLVERGVLGRVAAAAVGAPRGVGLLRPGATDRNGCGGADEEPTNRPRPQIAPGNCSLRCSTSGIHALACICGTPAIHGGRCRARSGV